MPAQMEIVEFHNHQKELAILIGSKHVHVQSYLTIIFIVKSWMMKPGIQQAISAFSTQFGSINVLAAKTWAHIVCVEVSSRRQPGAIMSLMYTAEHERRAGRCQIDVSKELKLQVAGHGRLHEPTHTIMCEEP